MKKKNLDELSEAQGMEEKDAPSQSEAPENELPEANSEVVEEEHAVSPEVMSILKNYKDYPRLFVDSKLGVYTEDTDDTLLGDAELYENPFFNEHN